MMIRIILMSCLFIPTALFAQSGVPYTVDIVATVPGCGDGFIQTGEQCDGATLGGTSCSLLGFSGGVLSCSSACTFVTDQCVLGTSRNSSGATRTIGNGTPFETTNLVVSGNTVPGATVTLLRDGQASGLAVVRPDGSYQITAVGFAPGTYLVQLSIAVPGAQVTTSDTVLVRIVEGATTKVSGVVVPIVIQTLMITDSMVSLRALAIPDTIVSLQIGGVAYVVAVPADGQIVFTEPVASPSDVVITATYNGVDFLRQYTQRDLDVQAGDCRLFTDTSGDCRVNVLDFAPMSFAVVRGIFLDRFDFDNDGSITIRDFSILAYYWTG